MSDTYLPQEEEEAKFMGDGVGGVGGDRGGGDGMQGIVLNISKLFAAGQYSLLSITKVQITRVIDRTMISYTSECTTGVRSSYSRAARAAAAVEAYRNIMRVCMHWYGCYRSMGKAHKLHLRTKTAKRVLVRGEAKLPLCPVVSTIPLCCTE